MSNPDIDPKLLRPLWNLGRVLTTREMAMIGQNVCPFYTIIFFFVLSTTLLTPGHAIIYMMMHVCFFFLFNLTPRCLISVQHFMVMLRDDTSRKYTFNFQWLLQFVYITFLLSLFHTCYIIPYHLRSLFAVFFVSSGLVIIMVMINLHL